MTKRTASAEIRRTDSGYVAVTTVNGQAGNYPLPSDPADAQAYAAHFRAEAERQGYTVSVRIDE